MGGSDPAQGTNPSTGVDSGPLPTPYCEPDGSGCSVPGYDPTAPNTGTGGGPTGQ